jgi:hypothetical protein
MVSSSIPTRKQPRSEYSTAGGLVYITTDYWSLALDEETGDLSQS